MRREIPRSAAMGAVFGLGGTLLLPILLLVAAPLLTDARTIRVGVYMPLVPMFLGYVLFGHALSLVPVRAATTITLSEPAIAALLAVLVVGERLAAIGWIGLAIIRGSLLVFALPTNSRQAPTPSSHTEPENHLSDPTPAPPDCGPAAGSARPERLAEPEMQVGSTRRGVP